MNLEDLKLPFEPSEIEFRAGATNSEKTRALALPYIDARLVMDRLDSVCGPENWRDEYQPGPAGGVICGLSLRIGEEWVTKWDGADNTDYEAIKGGLSDALKRAAVKWGIGRYLYALPGVWVSCEQAGKSVKIDEGEARAKLFGSQQQRSAPRQPQGRPAQNGSGTAQGYPTLEALVKKLGQDFNLTDKAAKAELKAAGYTLFKVSESTAMYQAVKARIEARNENA